MGMEYSALEGVGALAYGVNGKGVAEWLDEDFLGMRVEGLEGLERGA